MHELPPHARLRVVESPGGDLDAVRARIVAVKDEIGRIERIAVLSDDLGERIAHHVEHLARRARPVLSGIGQHESLRIDYPLHDHANAVTMSGFSPHEGNALLLAALLSPEKLAERLLQCAVPSAITAGEREQRLQALQAELTALRYAEEQAVTVALAEGFDAVRSSSAPPWATLMIAVEHHPLEAAA